MQILAASAACIEGFQAHRLRLFGRHLAEKTRTFRGKPRRRRSELVIGDASEHVDVAQRLAENLAVLTNWQPEIRRRVFGKLEARWHHTDHVVLLTIQR